MIAGLSSAWVTSRHPRLASNFLHSEPLHEYIQVSVQKIQRYTKIELTIIAKTNSSTSC
jgi:hypothetical protein